MLGLAHLTHTGFRPSKDLCEYGQEGNWALKALYAFVSVMFINWRHLACVLAWRHSFCSSAPLLHWGGGQPNFSRFFPMPILEIAGGDREKSEKTKNP